MAAEIEFRNLAELLQPDPAPAADACNCPKPGTFMGMPDPWGYIVLTLLIVLLLAGLWFLLKPKKKGGTGK